MTLKKSLLQHQTTIQLNSQDDPLSKIKPQSKQLIEKIILNIALLPFIMGYTVVYFNAINFQDLMQIMHLNFDKSFAQGFFTSCIPASACVGCLLSSQLLKIFSRKQFFYLINLTCILAIILIQTKILSLIILGRLFQGLIIGIGTVIVPLYNKEFIPEMNGKYGLYFQLFFTVGLVWAFLFNLILYSIFQNNTQSYWRILFVFPLPLSLVQSFIFHFYFNFQTPRYLISINKHQQAKDLLQKIYNQEFVEPQFQLLYKAVNSKPYKSDMIELKQCDVSQPLQKIKQCPSEAETQKNQRHQGKQKSNSLAVFCALHLSFQQQIVGIGAINAYAGDIIKEIIPSLFYYYAIIIHSIGLCCVFLGIFLIKSFGRVTLLQIGAGIISICLLITGINFLIGESGSPSIIGISVVVMRGTFSATLGPIPWLYMAEIVRPNIIPYGTFINWTVATLVMFLYPILTDILGGPGWIFIFNGILCIISMLLNSLTLVETKDKNQLQIQEEFNIKKLKLLKENFIKKYVY